MKELVLASNNKHKQKEIQEILKDYKILTLNDIDFKEDILEDADTFEGNSIKKAQTIYNFCKKEVIADDSGLCIELLNDRPGVYSARYSLAGDDNSNIEKVLAELGGKHSKAFFISVIAYINNIGEIKTFKGEVEGTIINEKIGDNGFGYDPIFYVEGYKKTFAQLTPEEKNSISHRKKAIDKFINYIKGSDSCAN